MKTLEVTAGLLNKRNAAVADTFNKSNVVGVVRAGFTFESVEEKTIGGILWYKDRDGNWYWSGGLKEVFPVDHDSPDAAPEKSLPQEAIPDTQKTGWAFSSPGIDVMQLWNSGYKGQNVRVAILDSGINLSISDLSNRIKDQNKDVKSFIPGESVSDDVGHGTACAAVLASSGEKFFGASPKCELIIAKVFSSNATIDFENVLKALKWACEDRNADIVNLSFGVPYACDAGYLLESWKPVADFINHNFKTNNKLFVAAIGDSGKYDKDNCGFPANVDGVLSVGAFDQQRIVCEISSWNKNLTMVAPGSGLSGYDKTGQQVILPDATSFSSPFMAGVLANLVGLYKLRQLPFSATDFVNKLAFDPLPDNDPVKNGSGIINIDQTLKNIHS